MKYLVAFLALLFMTAVFGPAFAADSSPKLTVTPTPTATPTPTPDPNQRGDCHVGSHTSTNRTKAECDDMNGKWEPNKLKYRTQARSITSLSVCNKLNLQFDAKNRVCLKTAGARPPHGQQSASGAQNPQQPCHNACAATASRGGGSVWYSGMDNGVCMCAICGISVPGLTRLTGKTICNVFDLGHNP